MVSEDFEKHMPLWRFINVYLSLNECAYLNACYRFCAVWCILVCSGVNKKDKKTGRVSGWVDGGCRIQDIIEQKAYGTGSSQAVPHPSTIPARRCLTSVIRRERVCSSWYGRRQRMYVFLSFYIPSACVKTAPTHAHVRTQIHIHTRSRPCIKITRQLIPITIFHSTLANSRLVMEFTFP